MEKYYVADTDSLSTFFFFVIILIKLLRSPCETLSSPRSLTFPRHSRLNFFSSPTIAKGFVIDLPLNVLINWRGKSCSILKFDLGRFISKF